MSAFPLKGMRCKGKKDYKKIETYTRKKNLKKVFGKRKVF